MDLRAEGDLLVVDARARIPKVCVKCGATKDVSRRELPFHVGHAASSASSVGAIVGVSVAAVMRNVFRDQPGTQAMIFGGLIAGAIAIAWIASRTQQKLHLEVPLCGAHHAALDAALRNRTWLLIAFAAAGVAAVVGLALESMVMMVGCLLLIFGGLGVALATGMKDAWVAARWAKDGRVALVVAPETAKKIVARAEKRARKKDADRTDEPDEAEHASEAP